MLPRRVSKSVDRARERVQKRATASGRPTVLSRARSQDDPSLAEAFVEMVRDSHRRQRLPRAAGKLVSPTECWIQWFPKTETHPEERPRKTRADSRDRVSRYSGHPAGFRLSECRKSASAGWWS